jgi:hypothetical protein
MLAAHASVPADAEQARSAPMRNAPPGPVRDMSRGRFGFMRGIVWLIPHDGYKQTEPTWFLKRTRYGLRLSVTLSMFS